MTVTASACECCGRPLRAGWRFIHSNAPGHRCFRCAFRHPPMLQKAIKLSVVVGTLLTTINQGDVILGGRLTKLGVAKILMTYTVPFCVSVYSVLANARVPASQKAGS